MPVIHTCHVLRRGSNMGVLGELAWLVRDGRIAKSAETGRVSTRTRAPTQPEAVLLRAGGDLGPGGRVLLRLAVKNYDKIHSRLHGADRCIRAKRRRQLRFLVHADGVLRSRLRLL
jgi:hypothetical protein